MVKIKLTRYGDIISAQSNYILADKIAGIKLHKTCDSFIDLLQTTKTHQVLACRVCNFRFLFPLEIQTWAELKTWLLSE